MITTTLKQYSSLPLQLITGSIVITYRFDTTIFFNQHFSWHYLCHMVNTNWNVLKIIGEDCKLLIHLTKHEDVAPLLGHRSCLCRTSDCMTSRDVIGIVANVCCWWVHTCNTHTDSVLESKFWVSHNKLLRHTVQCHTIHWFANGIAQAAWQFFSPLRHSDSYVVSI